MKNIFEVYPKKYDAWYDRNKLAYLSEIEAFKIVIPKEGRGLEIGVGTGRFASALGIQMGIDPSHDMIEIARQRGVNVCWGLGEDLPFLDNAFDYAVIIVTLSFVDNPLGVIKEAWRVLENSGKLIIGIIDRNSFLGEFYRTKKSVFYQEANLLTVKELTALLKTAGFSSFSYYQTIFRLPSKIDSIEKPQRGFGKGGFVVVSAGKII
ncbi:MAG: class I SAM-dependent methyltransferase [Candidatus Omnitrophica bacterium]|nr:class I SAM-dependent methyltransferase [Candidatus Omnitrophota bacterium]